MRLAGGLVIQSLIAHWLHLQWDLSAQTLGVVIFCVNVNEWPVVSRGRSAGDAHWIGQHDGVGGRAVERVV
jgi:hypothetical protein